MEKKKEEKTPEPSQALSWGGECVAAQSHGLSLPGERDETTSQPKDHKDLK